MNLLTEECLAILWAADDVTLAERNDRDLELLEELDLPGTGVIGRELLVGQPAAAGEPK